MEVLLSAFLQLQRVHQPDELNRVFVHDDVKAPNFVIKQMAAPGQGKKGKVVDTSSVLLIDLATGVMVSPEKAHKCV